VINEPIKIGNGISMYAIKIGKSKRTVIQRNGDTLDVVLMDVKYVPDVGVNLFSIGKALHSRIKIGNKGLTIYLMKGSFKMSFNRLMATKKGYVMGIDMVPVISNVATAVLDKGVFINMNTLHKMLGHVGKDATIKTAEVYGHVCGTMDSHAGLPQKLQKGLWAECAKTATMMENMIMTTNKPVSSYSQFSKKEPKHARSLKTFGDIGVMTCTMLKSS
jgi:hypothetical protein